MLLEFALGLLALLLIWDYLNKKHQNYVFETSAINGPKALPVLGNALLATYINTENSIQYLRDFKRKYGKICRFWMLHQPFIVIMDPKYLEEILSSPKIIKKGTLYDPLVDWLGRGVLLSWGNKWHSRRNIITPAFHFKILEHFAEIFDQQSSVMVNKLYEKADGQTAIDIYPVVSLCTLDIIAESAMGVKLNAQDDPGLEYVEAIATLSRIMFGRFTNPSLNNKLLFRLTAPKMYYATQRCTKVLHKFNADVIEQRRSALSQSVKNDSLEKEAESMALLDVLLQSTINGQPLSNEDIREEVDTFMFAGHDTITSAISFTLYSIAQHSEVQAKLLAEIQEIIGNDRDKQVTYHDLQELKYMELVIKESLRLYPSSPVIGREIEEDITVGDITLPARTNISIPLFMVLRDPDYFTSPNDFKPERFENECPEKIHPFAYIPFSAGPRNCIGQKFAMLEIKSTVSKILRHFEILPFGPDVKPVIRLTLGSRSGVHIALRPWDL